MELRSQSKCNTELYVLQLSEQITQSLSSFLYKIEIEVFLSHSLDTRMKLIHVKLLKIKSRLFFRLLFYIFKQLSRNSGHPY